MVENIIHYQKLTSYFVQFFTNISLEKQFQASRQFVPEVMKACITTFKNYFAKENPVDPDRRIIVLAQFIANCYFCDVMNAEDFNNYVEIILNATSKSITETKSTCLFFIDKETIEKMKLDFPYFLNLRVKYVQELVLKSFIKPFMTEQVVKKPVTSKVVEVSTQPLQFSQLKPHKTEVCAQMIADSVMKIPDLTPSILAEYTKFCIHIQTYKPKFHTSICEKLRDKITILIMAPSLFNYCWQNITKFAMFLASLYENSFDVGDVLNELVTRMNERIVIQDQKKFKLPPAVPIFTKFFYKVFKVYNKKTIKKFPWFLDFLRNSYPTSVEYEKEMASEIYDHFDNAISIKNPTRTISPSFLVILDGILTKDNSYDGSISNLRIQDHVNFFIEIAMEPKNRSVLVQSMKKWKETKPEDTKMSPLKEPAFVEEVIKKIDEEFCDIFHHDKAHDMPQKAILICEFIAELYTIDLYPTRYYEARVERIIRNTQENPTLLNLLCFKELVVIACDSNSERENAALNKIAKDAVKDFESELKVINTEMGSDNLEIIDQEELFNKKIKVMKEKAASER